MSPLRIVVALLIVSAVLFGTHYYIWARLVRDAEWPPPWRMIGTGVLIGLASLIVVGIALRRAPRSVVAPVMWVAYSWLGLMFFLVVLLAGVDLVRGLASMWFRWSSSPPQDPERRVALSRWLSAFVGFSAVALGGVSALNALRTVAVKRVRIELKKLPVSASGYRIALLSDVHVGPTIGKGFIEEIVRRVNALEPDLVAIAGDLVDGSVAELGPLLAPLAGLRCACKGASSGGASPPGPVPSGLKPKETASP